MSSSVEVEVGPPSWLAVRRSVGEEEMASTRVLVDHGTLSPRLRWEETKSMGEVAGKVCTRDIGILEFLRGKMLEMMVFVMEENVNRRGRDFEIRADKGGEVRVLSVEAGSSQRGKGLKGEIEGNSFFENYGDKKVLSGRFTWGHR